MRAALDFSLGDPAEVAAGAVLGTAVGGIAILTGLVREGRRWIHRALDSLQEVSAERARLLWIGGQLALEEFAIYEAETMLTDSGPLPAGGVTSRPPQSPRPSPAPCTCDTTSCPAPWTYWGPRSRKCP
ncbi:hypothetical protein AB0H00_22305 [Nocardia sp. NPDC023852]|uniref:hypothetical protein n=1 Tax=Nocardia sp. NPDC023852 TaxID=3154697 RepID=UPI0033E86817